MFGLTKREQRWKADQRAAETLAGVVKAALYAKAQVAASEVQVTELEALRSENARLRADKEAAESAEKCAAELLEVLNDISQGEPLGEEFEAVWDSAKGELYEE